MCGKVSARFFRLFANLTEIFLTKALLIIVMGGA